MQLTTHEIMQVSPPRAEQGVGDYSSESFVDKGKTPEDPLTWKHKEMLAILGTADSLGEAPYGYKEVEIWGIAQCVTFANFKRADLLFEIHQESYWREIEGVLKRLQATKIPIYMMNQYEEIPTSIRFPIEIVSAYKNYHRTSITYMLALAYHLFKATGNPKSVALFGVHMEGIEEYMEQRPCCEYWLGRMEEAGMDINIAHGSIMTPPGLYAYEDYHPAIPQLRNRVNMLQAGLTVKDSEIRKKRDEYYRQEGAIKEATHWLRAFQRGDPDKTTIK